MPVSAVYSGVVVVVMMTVVFMVAWSSRNINSSEIDNDPSDGFFTYEDWIHSEKEISVYVEDPRYRFEDCLRITYANAWPPWQNASAYARMKMIGCKDRPRTEQRRTGKPHPEHKFLTLLMKIPLFWRDHKLIYRIVISLSHQAYKEFGKSNEEIEDAIGDFESYESWIDSEKKIKFERGRNMTYQKCVKMDYARVWDEEDKAQRLSRIKCKSMARDVFNRWVRSDEPWPPMEFFRALLKVPSFWRNHTQIFNSIIRPAQFYNRPDGGRRHFSRQHLMMRDFLPFSGMFVGLI